MGLLILSYVTGNGVENETYYNEVIADSPFLYWRLHESSGTVMDSGTSGTNLAPVHSVVYSQPGPLGGGQTTSSIEFDGNAPTPAHLTNGSAPMGTGNIATYSWDCMIYRGANINGHFFAQSIGAGIVDWNIGGEIITNGVGGSVSPGINSFLHTSPITINTWYHAAFVQDPTAVKKRVLYLNGVEAGSSNVVSQYQGEPTDTITLGARPTMFGLLAPFTGRLSEMAIYTTALSPVRVAAHAAAVSG